MSRKTQSIELPDEIRYAHLHLIGEIRCGTDTIKFDGAITPAAWEQLLGYVAPVADERAIRARLASLIQRWDEREWWRSNGRAKEARDRQIALWRQIADRLNEVHDLIEQAANENHDAWAISQTWGEPWNRDGADPRYQDGFLRLREQANTLARPTERANNRPPYDVLRELADLYEEHGRHAGSRTEPFIAFIAQFIETAGYTVGEEPGEADYTSDQIRKMIDRALKGRHQKA